MNFYLQLTERKSMVEILCPHCEEEIQLDDDAAGEFGSTCITFGGSCLQPLERTHTILRAKFNPGRVKV